jgi:hypothetical protein
VTGDSCFCGTQPSICLCPVQGRDPAQYLPLSCARVGPNAVIVSVLCRAGTQSSICLYPVQWWDPAQYLPLSYAVVGPRAVFACILCSGGTQRSIRLCPVQGRDAAQYSPLSCEKVGHSPGDARSMFQYIAGWPVSGNCAVFSVRCRGQEHFQHVHQLQVCS